MFGRSDVSMYIQSLDCASSNSIVMWFRKSELDLTQVMKICTTFNYKGVVIVFRARIFCSKESPEKVSAPRPM